MRSYIIILDLAKIGKKKFERFLCLIKKNVNKMK